ncbi:MULTISPECIES: benzoate/H(+) symporter BenE family transporter [unclassified Halomonas]|uniref:Benzoate/H(+) symporter BenE family transporter n=1 Tax=Halomonas sp. RT37 TaxID=2950872 RepID=A0AAU7KMB4_9GAMM|nr:MULTISPECIES: benzoate/H(+) symporter BenE family transporter [unclassified Halomonas]MCJ8286818.1 benzoate/H(+) symporter BenE family transporter [Halomonas sp.]MCO7217790.1 benzoate/H(+) symporter BenE family transporter [Halomonas sp. OfavH-34-E]
MKASPSSLAAKAGQTHRPKMLDDLHPSTLAAGFAAVLIGYASSAAIIFQAAQAAAIDQAQIGSWMWALGIGMGVTSLGLSWRYRMPLLTAWSTPGAALLVTQLPGVPFDQAVGAFLLSSLLMLAVAASGLVERIMAVVPASIASAMLAGILLPFVLEVFTTVQTDPWLPLALLGVWMLCRRLAPRLAIVTVLAAGVALCLGRGDLSLAGVAVSLTRPAWVTPAFDPVVCLGIGIPLFAVTLTTQNLPGFAMVRSAGFTPPVAASLGATGLASLLMAPFGGHGVNMAAISAAPCLGEEAHREPGRRYTAGIAAGMGYLLLGALGATVASLFDALPSAMIAVVAGLALMATLGGALRTAFSDGDNLDAVLVTFAITASPLTLAGIGSAFWGLVAGLIVLRLQRRR